MSTKRTQLTVRLSRLALVAVILVLCGTGVGTTDARALATATITFTCCAYSPPTLFITAGDTVTWQGDFSFHPLVSDDGLWSTRSTGTEFSFTFPAAGIYLYHCAIHGGAGGVGMSGRVIVLRPGRLYLPLMKR